MKYTKEEMLSKVDHTLLKPEATWPQIRTLCDEAIANHCASVCINTCYVKQAVEYMAGRVPVCCVVGFPLGAMDTKSKAFEAKTAIENGASEVDMVINIGWLKNKQYDDVRNDIAAVKAAVGDKVLKVIIETCLLTDDEKIKMCDIVPEAGADFIKTSTGFSTGGATFHDIELFAKHVAGRCKIKAATEIDGFKLQMYAPLEGPGGAHHQPKSRTGSGIMFPAKTAERDDFERIVRTIDEMFYSEENAKLWCLGVEGETYTMDGDKIVYSDEIVNSADGIYKSMQLKYGCGSDVTQMVWINAREMSKYDENYAKINSEVAAMPDAIQPVPPTPQFDDLTAEDAASLRTPLGDTFEVWADAFITGKKSTDTDWDAYVAEMKNLSIDEYLQMYNDNK